MPKRIVPLSDIAVSRAKRGIKDIKKYDGGGLYLLVTASGGKLWRCKYNFGGKEKLLSFGAYPQVSLSDARKLREEAKVVLSRGEDPGQEVKAKKAASGTNSDTFECIAWEWFNLHKSEWIELHALKKEQSWVKNLLPFIGNTPVYKIATPELLARLLKVSEQGSPSVAKRLRYDCEKIFAYAIASGRATSNPALQLRGILPTIRATNFPALTDPTSLKELLKKIHSYRGSFVIQSALKLAPLLFVRPGELRNMEWSEVNLEEGVWCIPGNKMKMKKPHVVPLSRQALEILIELKGKTGVSIHVFPNSWASKSATKPMGTHAINTALRRLGFDKDTVVGHGFRATARTLIRERLKLDAEYIEIQLAHLTKAPNGTAYDRVAFLDERKDMMQRWADYLDILGEN